LCLHRLPRMRQGIVENAIRPDYHGKEIIETERSDYVETVVILQADADSVNNRGVSLQRLICASQLRVPNAEAILEPEMYASLVPDLDRTDAIRCRVNHASNHCIL